MRKCNIIIYKIDNQLICLAEEIFCSTEHTCASHKSPLFPRQELISRVPKGEEMTRKLSSLLADNSTKFGYSDAVVKSLKMELHAVAERIRYLMFRPDMFNPA